MVLGGALVVLSGGGLQNIFLQQQTAATMQTISTMRLPTVIVTEAVTPRAKKRLRKEPSETTQNNPGCKYINSSGFRTPNNCLTQVKRINKYSTNVGLLLITLIQYHSYFTPFACEILFRDGLCNCSVWLQLHS